MFRTFCSVLLSDISQYVFLRFLRFNLFALQLSGEAPFKLAASNTYYVS